jgi:hypothetical protein
MKSRPVLIGNSILAMLQVLASAAALGDVLGKTNFAMFSILVGAATVGFNTYVQGIVVPTNDVGAYTNGDGRMIAGPAAGVQNGAPVNVEQVPPNTARGLL